MKHLRKIHDSLKPLYYASKVSGTLSITLDEKTGTTKVSKSSIVYSTVKALVFVGCFVYACEDVKTPAYWSNNSISDATGLFDLYSGITTQTTYMFLCCINAKRYVQLIRGLANIDKQLEYLGGIVDYAKTNRFALWGTFIVAMEFIVTFATDYALFVDDENTVYLIVSYYTIITLGIVKLQIGVVMFLLMQRFKLLNNLLKHLGRTRHNIIYVKGRFDSHIINTAHNIHNHLCQMCSLINYLYGIPLVLISGSAFVISVNEMYYCYTKLKETPAPNLAWDIYFSLQWVALQILEMYGIVFVAEKTNKEIRKITTFLHDIRNNTADKQIIAEIHKFALHMTHNRINFNACGLFSLNYMFFNSMISGITSYIIIMIQFDIAKNGLLSRSNNTYLPMDP